MQDKQKRTWAEVSLNALSRNVAEFREHIPEGCKLCGVVKANAYGHGAAFVAKALEKLRCDYLAVATIDEAEELRAEGITLPILILSYTPAVFIERVIESGCIQTLGCPEAAEAYSRALAGSKRKLTVHIKLETGMGRTGFDVKNGEVGSVASALELPHIEAEGIFSHFASADDPSSEGFTMRQFELFMTTADKIEKYSDKKFAIRHCANSAAMLSYPETHLDMVRAGISLYGVYPSEGMDKPKLSPVMALKTRVIQVSELSRGESVSYGRTFTADRDMKIAVLPVGYADGLHRVLSGKLEVIIRGRRCRQAGTICMDMCMVDVSALEGVAAGDVAVVFGNDGGAAVSVDELAQKAGTISYEMLCAVSPRVPRIYLGML